MENMASALDGRAGHRQSNGREGKLASKVGALDAAIFRMITSDRFRRDWAIRLERMRETRRRLPRELAIPGIKVEKEKMIF